MKLLLLSIFCFASLLALTQPRKLSAETIIQQVTVFSSGAQIQRTATVAVLPGRTEISFSGLSNQLDPQSVQLKADANIVLLSVQANKDFFGERKVEQEERNLLEKQTTLKDRIDMDQKLLEVYRQEESMVVKNQEIAGTSGVKASDLEAALNLQRQRLTDLYQRQLELQKRLQNLQQELDRTRLQLGEVSKKKDSVNYAVTVLIDSKETRSIRFILTYLVKDAGWYPTYDIRVGELDKPIDLMMNANVFQRSGETWKEVSVFLSTGSPSDNATPSQLQPWMLGYFDPATAWMRSQTVQPGVVMGRVANEKGEPIIGASVQIKGGFAGTITDGNGYFKLQNLPVNAVAIISSVGYDSKSFAVKPGYYNLQLKQSAQALDEVVVVGYSSSSDVALQGKAAGVQIRGANAQTKKLEELQTVSVNTDYKPTTTIFEIQDKYSLETDGKTTTISIRRVSVPAIFEYYAVPKLDPAAFLNAKVINWQELDLQAGEANLFLEGTYLGKTYLDLANAGDTLLLALGKDNGIRIQRKLVKEFSSRRLIGANRTESKGFEISVRNNKKIPVNLMLLDQFPVSVNKDIEIDDRKAPEGLLDKETGIVTWNLALAAGEEKKLSLNYSVKYPKDRKVILE